MKFKDFKDVVRFNKTSNATNLLGMSAEGGRFIYGGIRQFESYYGPNSTDGDQNICRPTNLHLSKDDFADFNFQSDSNVVLLSMGGSLLNLDLNTKKLINSVNNLERSVFCNTFENPGIITSC